MAKPAMEVPRSLTAGGSMMKSMSLRRQRWLVLMYGNGFDPFLVPYLAAKNFPTKEILVLLALRQFLRFPLSIPTGWFADRRGRTLSLSIGSAACALSMVAYGLANTWPVILAASVLTQIGKNFFSGADGALARQTHQALSRYWKSEHKLYVAEVASFQGLVELACCVGATVLAMYFGLLAVVLAQGLVYLAVLVLVLTLEEPPRSSPHMRRGKSQRKRDAEILDARQKFSVSHPSAYSAFERLLSDPFTSVNYLVQEDFMDFGLGSFIDGRFVPFLTRHELLTRALNVTSRRPKIGVRQFVVQTPMSFHAPVVLEVIPFRDKYSLRANVIKPENFAKSWPRVTLGRGGPGSWVTTAGPARRLTGEQYEELMDGIHRRELRLRWWALVALVAGLAAITSLTAVTYRLAPLCYASVRWHGRPLPVSWFGGVWGAYLASVWLLGKACRRWKWTRRWRSIPALAALAGLGAGCFFLLGLTTAAWGLAAIAGLALVRSLEMAVAGDILNELVSDDSYAVLLSALWTVQDTIAAGVLLLVGWLTTTSSFQVGLMVVGGVHIVIAGLAFTVLARLYKS